MFSATAIPSVSSFRERRIFLALFSLGVASAQPAHGEEIFLWHNLEMHQAALLQDLAKSALGDSDFELRIETGFDLSTALARRHGRRKPDLVLAPADLAVMDGLVHFSSIPSGLRAAGTPKETWRAVSSKGKVVGIPVFVGNHLMLFFNRRMASRPPNSFDEFLGNPTPAKKPAFAWQFREPYFTFPFLGVFESPQPGGARPTCPFSDESMARGLEVYRKLALDRVVPRDCEYECMTNGFYRGDYPFTISGDWALEEARRRLGDDLGVAPLPSLSGKRVPSYYMPTALFFPDDSLNGPNAALLARLAKAISGPEAQRTWLERGQRIPADRSVIPRSLRSPGLRDSYRILKEAHPFPQLPNAWFWPALRRSFELYLDHGAAALEAAKLVSKICALQASAPEERTP